MKIILIWRQGRLFQVLQDAFSAFSEQVVVGIVELDFRVYNLMHSDLLTPAAHQFVRIFNFQGSWCGQGVFTNDFQWSDPVCRYFGRFVLWNAEALQHRYPNHSWYRYGQILDESMQALEDDPTSLDLQFVQASEPRREIWQVAFPQTMSSTVQKLLMVGRHDAFGMFEPCHSDDEHRYNVSSKCGADLCWYSQCIRDMFDCNLSKMKRFHHHGKLSNTSKCQSSSDIFIKSISVKDLRMSVVPILEIRPKLHVLHVIRDPRAIWQSLKMAVQKNEFVATLETNSRSWIGATCAVMHANLHVSHSRIHKVLFDDLVLWPEKSFKRIFHLFGLDFGPRQKAYIRRNFGNSHCPPDSTYSSCNRNSSEKISAWSTTISPEDLLGFRENVDCKKVIEYYGF